MKNNRHDNSKYKEKKKKNYSALESTCEDNLW